MEDKKSQDKHLSVSELKNVVQDCNVNFLVGAGMSAPYLSPLGQVEKLLTDLSKQKEHNNIDETTEKVTRAFIYKSFFEKVIWKNLDIVLPFSKDKEELSSKEKPKSVLKNYETFINIINTVILNRRSTILSRQVNIFTTNFDLFFEKTMEHLNVEYNDGFSGHFNPEFDIGHFKKSVFKKSLHYDNTYELPVFNLIKLHGSLTWQKEPDTDIIRLDRDLKQVSSVKEKLPTNESFAGMKDLDKDSKIEHLVNHISKKSLLSKKSLSEKFIESIKLFIEEYEKLSIINPTKEKFKQTVLNRNYYDMLRLYSTELEKENTVLFVMGFSFSDEHIKDVTVRAADSNPTLKIYVFCHEDKTDMESKIGSVNNKNIMLIDYQSLKDRESNDKELNIEKLCFKTLNEKVFEKILGKTNE